MPSVLRFASAESARFLLAVSLGVTLLVVLRLLWVSDHGFDFTDEGFHVAWMANPQLYDVSVTQFGFVHHPFYLLAGGDLVTLRRGNILLVLGLSWALSAVWLAGLTPGLAARRGRVAILSAGLAVGGFCLFGDWLLTPSYNSLALQALMMATLGLFLTEDASGRWAGAVAGAGAVLVGLGGWLAFMAKPTTAACLLAVVLAYLLVTRRMRPALVLLALAVAATLVLLAAIVIDGSVAGFAARLVTGVELAAQLEGKYTLTAVLRIDRIPFGPAVDMVIVAVLAGFAVALGAAAAPSGPFAPVAATAVSMLILGAAGLAVALALGLVGWPQTLGAVASQFRLRYVIAALLVVLLLRHLAALWQTPLHLWARMVLLLGMPHVYSLGTNGNYWMHGAQAALFWVLGGTMFLRPALMAADAGRVLLPVVVAVQAVAAGLVFTGFDAPYRQPPRIAATERVVPVGMPASNLVLADTFARYITTARGVAQVAGWQPGTPVIDLTGQSPGLLQAMGAVNLGLPWVIGGYAGSADYVVGALGRVSCAHLATAWVLLEPEGPRRLPETVLRRIGADFPGGYTRVGTWQVAPDAGGYPARGLQSLYKPRAVPEARQACARLRATAEG